MNIIQRPKSQECSWLCDNRGSMTTIEALRLQIDTLQLERQQFECKNSKLELEKNRYEEHEHSIVENEQLKALYEELLKKIEEEGTVGGDKASETANIAQKLMKSS